MDTIRVSLRPHLYSGRDGYKVSWTDPTGTNRRYFVLHRQHALEIKRRVKNGMLPPARIWAIKV